MLVQNCGAAQMLGLMAKMRSDEKQEKTVDERTAKVVLDGTYIQS